MAPGFVQGTSNARGTSGTVVSKAFVGNVTSGDIVVAFVLMSNAATTTVFSNSGTAAITWNGSGVTKHTLGSNFLFRSDGLVTSTGTCTITSTSDFSTGFADLYIGEFNIGGHALARDGSPNFVLASQGTTTSFASGSITTVNNPDLLICWYDNNGGGTAFTGGISTGWAENVWDSGQQMGFSSSLVTTPGSYSLTATQVSGGDDSLIVAYQSTPVPINATVSVAGKGVFSHGGRLLNNSTVSI